MFYDKQPIENRQAYKGMLSAVGSLSRLFSESDCPYLAYRAHENIFCKYLEAENLARSDCSADAKKGHVGIGLKTWMGNDDQKVAEFGKLKSSYSSLSGLDLVKKIAEYRNNRIRVTMKIHGIEEMVYHIVKRVPHCMQIFECCFDPIDINNIKLLPNKGNDNNTYFTDGKHEYHFSASKNTLFMIFSDMELVDSVDVEIVTDPFTLIGQLMAVDISEASKKLDNVRFIKQYSIFNYKDDEDVEIDVIPYKDSSKEQLCLRIYSIKRGSGEKYVPEGSGLNQWNAKGRKRDANEIYIPYPVEDRKRNPDFFPPRDENFSLLLPNGTIMSAKVCQDDGKAIMSNPNKDLGKWLLRDVFEVPEGTLITYEMLEKFGVDSVVFTKNGEGNYAVDFSEIGTYEAFYGEEGD